MANSIRFESDEGDYKTTAYDFTLADDLYLFFKFESPKSNCEIGIAYDEYVDGGDWYVQDGTLGGCDHEIVNDIIWSRLPRTEEFDRVDAAVQRAIRAFNEQED